MTPAVQQTFLAKPCLDICSAYLSEDPRAIHGLLRFFRKLNPKSLVCLANYLPVRPVQLQENYRDEQFDEALLEGVNDTLITQLLPRIVKVDLSHHTSERLLAIMQKLQGEDRLSRENLQRVMLQSYWKAGFLEQCTKLFPTVCQDRIYLVALKIVQMGGLVLTDSDAEFYEANSLAISELLCSTVSERIASLLSSLRNINPVTVTRFGHLDLMTQYLNEVDLNLTQLYILIHESVKSKQLSILKLLINKMNSKRMGLVGVCAILHEEVGTVKNIFEDAVRSGSVEIVAALHTLSACRAYLNIRNFDRSTQLSVELDYVGITFFLINSIEFRIDVHRFITLFSAVESVAMFQMLADDSCFKALPPNILDQILMMLKSKHPIWRHFLTMPIASKITANYLFQIVLNAQTKEDVILIQSLANFNTIEPSHLAEAMCLFRGKGDEEVIVQIARSNQVAKFSQGAMESWFKSAVQNNKQAVLQCFIASPHMEKISFDCLGQCVVDAAKVGDPQLVAILFSFPETKKVSKLYLKEAIVEANKIIDNNKKNEILKLLSK